MDAVAYASQTKGLLPAGAAWNGSTDSFLWKLLLASGDGAERLDARAFQLLEEADPRTTNELIDAWETVAALPDACTGELTSIDDRRVALWQKLTQTGGQTIAYYEAVALRLGCVIIIHEFPTFHAGSYCGSPCYGPLWKYVWQVEVLSATNGTDVLVCVLRRLKPAHTAVIFDNTDAFTPFFFYDFTA